jgi:hypothetical protein
VTNTLGSHLGKCKGKTSKAKTQKVEKDALSTAGKERMGVISKAVPCPRKKAREFYVGTLYIST